MEQTGQHKKACLQRIANILMINSGYLDNPGLYTGEMGIVLFFFRYARFTHNGLFAEYGFDLIEMLQNRIDAGMPVSYPQGLTGIGSAIEYLVQNGFIEACTDDVLEEFDERIFSENSLPSYSLDELLGVRQYTVWRMSGESYKKDSILKTALSKVENLIEKDGTFDFQQSFRNLTQYRLSGKNSPYRLESENYRLLLAQFSEKHSFNINAFSLGIENGLAGLGLCLMTALDGDDSWTSLFDQD